VLRGRRKQDRRSRRRRKITRRITLLLTCIKSKARSEGGERGGVARGRRVNAREDLERGESNLRWVYVGAILARRKIERQGGLWGGRKRKKVANGERKKGRR
jgi:hypothetical protein